MTITTPSCCCSCSGFIIFIAAAFLAGTLTPTFVKGLGSSSTVSITYGANTTVCGIIAGQGFQSIQCYQQGRIISVQPNVPFEAISGGRSFFCGLRFNGHSLHCWDTNGFQSKRIYYSKDALLADVSVGDTHVCALEIGSGVAKCWRGGEIGGSSFKMPEVGWKFRKITSGRGFSCGILRNDSRVLCWGGRELGDEIEGQFGKVAMSSIVAGDSHVCGLTRDGGVLICKGKNSSGQLNVLSSSPYKYSDVALGANHTCALQKKNGFVMCWGGGMEAFNFNISFESIVASSDFTCGLTTKNLSVICWGKGWLNNVLPLPMVIPGPCVSSCNDCGVYPDSETLCNGNGIICKVCDVELPIAFPIPHIPSSPSQIMQPNSSASNPRNGLFLVFTIVGSVGFFTGFCAIIYCLWVGVCGFLFKKIHVTGQPNTIQTNVVSSDVLHSRSTSIKTQNSIGSLRRQRSGTSSKHSERANNFSFSELATATNNFSVENKIGGGSFGTVYKGRLNDGREVAIKRGEIGLVMLTKKFEEKETAFDSELALLSRLHHKHLVDLVGFCQVEDERLLVYEYMINGALYNHLHSPKNVDKSSSVLNTWRMRIKIALDAARGIEYLHNYAVPPVIHRDIKSSNILLDSNWTARVSDFGLSLMGPDPGQEFMSIKAVGTVGYIDPEYYVLNILTAKSDIYGLGIVLLELLTGKRAVFKNEDDGTGPMSVTEYAVPLISGGELWKILDTRVGSPDMQQEAEAVELVAYTARNCVNLEGKNRPNMIDIVANLERALALCDSCHGSFSTATLSGPFE